jgi:hypothetical protein
VGKDDWEEAKAAEATVYFIYFKDIEGELAPYFSVKSGFRPGDAVSRFQNLRKS